jgi:hypothetical protein
MTEFEFKYDNQKVTPHYHPLTLPVDGSAGDTAQAVASGSTPTRALPPTPGRR